MAFKTNAVKRTVTGTFQRADGTPSKGRIWIKLSEPVQGREENVIYTGEQLEIPLDATGTFSKQLAVTAPGLTSEERAALSSVQTQRSQNAIAMTNVQARINLYLKKLQANTAVTPQETNAYNADVKTKQDLQAQAMLLAAQEAELVNYEKSLEKLAVRMQITCDFTGPTYKKKMTFILRPGTSPIDIADIPQED